MKKLDRRDFLRRLAAVSAAALLVPSSLRAQPSEHPFELLIIGDSLIWGQGLEEKDKFYTLTAKWLEEVHFGGRRTVKLKVKAHSGSTIKFHPGDAEKYRRAGRDEATAFHPEVNVGFPSSWKQVELAVDEYRAAGLKGADLMMISGGITDITTSAVFDPNGDDELLRARIKQHCGDDMYEVLDLAVQRNPGVQIAVIGYFHALTEYTSSSKALNAWLEALSFPRALKFVANNPLVRPLYFNRLKKRSIRRSKLWHEESDRQLSGAVDRINAKHGPGTAVFIRTPLKEEHATEAPNTMLFRMGKGGIVKDPKARERIKACRKELPPLKKETAIDYPVRLCEIAAIGHPDQRGARAYADAINSRLSSWLRK